MEPATDGGSSPNKSRLLCFATHCLACTCDEVKNMNPGTHMQRGTEPPHQPFESLLRALRFSALSCSRHPGKSHEIPSANHERAYEDQNAQGSKPTYLSSIYLFVCMGEEGEGGRGREPASWEQA